MQQDRLVPAKSGDEAVFPACAGMSGEMQFPLPRFRGVDRTQILELYTTGFPLARE